MKEEMQRIAIAEACGWRNVGDHREENGGITAPFPVITGNPPGVVGLMGPVPFYTTDLNAMHKAEGVLYDNGQGDDFEFHLGCVCCKVDPKGPVGHYAPHELEVAGVSSTAAQRAEAFLKTLNLWDA